jgi:hypothetical protein
VISETNESLVRGKKNIVNERQYYIQVSSTRSVVLAEKEFTRITKKHHSILKNFDHKIIRYTLKDKGLFFKLLIGPLKGPEHARLMCKKLIQSKQSCIVKRI